MNNKSWRAEMPKKLSCDTNPEYVIRANYEHQVTELCTRANAELDAKDATITALDGRFSALASELHCDVEEIESGLHSVLYANSMLEIENREKDARIAELEEIPESIRHSEMVKGLEAVIRGLESRAEQAEARVERNTDWYQQRFNALRRWVNDEVLPLSKEVAHRYFAICANGSPSPHESADWRDTLHARDMQIEQLKTRLADRARHDDDVRELIRFEAGGDGDVIDESVIERLLSAPYWKGGK